MNLILSHLHSIMLTYCKTFQFIHAISMKIKFKMPNYVALRQNSHCISNLNHMLIIHAKYTQNYCIFTPNSFLVCLYLDHRDDPVSRWNSRSMLFYMWFFCWDAVCPNGISETVVKHCRDGCPDSEKWFDVPDCWDDHRNVVL